MKTIRGVLLDVDGTLVDSNDAHAHAWVRAFAEHGIDADFSKVRRRIGMGGDKLVPAVAGLDAESTQGKTIVALRARIFKREYLPSIQAFPQARELLQRMRRDGLRLVVASSAKEDELNPLLEICGATRLIESKTSSDDADHSKPDPDIVQAALQQLDLRAEQALMLGDTPYDVAAARRAGLGIVGLRCGGWTESELQGAVAIYNSPAELLTRYDASPFRG